MKKLLVITYYWPPSGGGGVQRWLKFVKFLRAFGWEPIVYTHSNGEVPVLDPSLEKEVPEDVRIIKRPIFEPYSLYKILTGQKRSQKVQTGFLSEGKNPGIAQKIGTWIRGNFFIPDARCFWIKPSIKYLNSIMDDIHPDAIATTGPPHSMHLIGAGLKKKHNIPWIADFRDPWTKLEFYENLPLTRFADKKHRKLEKKVLTNADLVIAVSKNWANDFKNLGAKKTVAITNGYDPDDFPKNTVPQTKYFTLTHSGYLNKDQNPEVLWEVLGELTRKNEAFKNALKIKFVGKTDHSVTEALEKNGLTAFTEKTGYLPHREAIIESQQASLLLIMLRDNTPESAGLIPGKLFEYLATQRPVLAIGPENGDTAKILKETGAGKAADFNNREAMLEHLLKYFNDYQNSSLRVESKSIEQYSRKALTQKLVQAIDSISGNTPDTQPHN